MCLVSVLLYCACCCRQQEAYYCAVIETACGYYALKMPKELWAIMNEYLCAGLPIYDPRSPCPIHLSYVEQRFAEGYYRWYFGTMESHSCEGVIRDIIANTVPAYHYLLEAIPALGVFTDGYHHPAVKELNGIIANSINYSKINKEITAWAR